MSNLALTHNEYIEKNLELIQNQNKLNATDLQNFAIQCKRTGLDPITRQIYAIPSGGKLNIMASIDGLRLIAERSGAYEGQTAPQWCGDDGVWKDVWLSKETPKACKIGVYKTKFREPLVAIALFDEYAGKQNGKLTYMWAKMPALMIAKVAEALALRKAFPNEMSGIYSTEEMEQATSSQEPSQAQKNVEKIAEVLKETGFEKLPNEYVFNFGVHNTKKFSDFDLHTLSEYIEKLEKGLKDGFTNGPVTGKLRENMSKAVAEFYNYRTQFTRRAEEPKFDSGEKIPN